MKNKSLLAFLAIPLAGLGIVGSVAFASSNTSTPTMPQAQVSQKTLSADSKEKDSEVPDSQEQALLQAKAKITADQAKVAAQAKVSGTVSSVKLDDEDGTAVYEVVIGNQEVKVNAVDGSIMKIEAADAETGSDNEDMTTGHGNEPNDGETKDDGNIR